MCKHSLCRLKWNSTNNHYSSPDEDIEVRAKDFGKISAIEYLDEGKHIPSFHGLVDHFVENYGYVRDKSIRAASYDWRLAEGIVYYSYPIMHTAHFYN